MSFESYIEEMKRLGWTDEELKKDFDLHEEMKGYDLPWFPFEKKKEEERNIIEI